MQTLTFSVILIFIVLSFVQARSWDNIDPDLGTSKKYFVESPNYSNILTLLKNRKTNSYRNNDDDNNSNQNIDDMSLRKLEQLTSANRRFFFVNSQKQNRPSHSSYGRKSHWDAFFG